MIGKLFGKLGSRKLVGAVAAAVGLGELAGANGVPAGDVWSGQVVIAVAYIAAQAIVDVVAMLKGREAPQIPPPPAPPAK